MTGRHPRKRGPQPPSLGWPEGDEGSSPSSGTDGDWRSTAVLAYPHRCLRPWVPLLPHLLLSACASAQRLPHGARVMSVSWAPDGRLATGDFHGDVRVWATDPKDGALLLRWRHPSSALRVAFSPDGRRVITSSEATVRLWEARSGREIPIGCPGASRRPGAVFHLAWRPDGRVAAYAGWRDGAIELVDAETGRCLGTLRGHSQMVSDLAWSPTGDRLATGAWDGTVAIWRPDASKPHVTLRGYPTGVVNLSWSSDGQRLASFKLFERRVYVWSGDDDGRQDVLEIPGTGAGPAFMGGVVDVSFQPTRDGVLAIANREQVYLVTPGGRWERLQLPDRGKNRTAVEQVAWSPDGRRCAARSLGGPVLIWDAVPGFPHEYPTSGPDIAWSRDGLRLAIAGDEGVAVVDAPRPEAP